MTTRFRETISRVFGRSASTDVRVPVNSMFDLDTGAHIHAR
jgi:hypothetical protein